MSLQELGDRLLEALTQMHREHEKFRDDVRHGANVSETLCDNIRETEEVFKYTLKEFVDEVIQRSEGVERA